MTAHQLLLFLHLLVIATGIGFSLSNFINVLLALKGQPETGKGLALHRMTIARLGDVVIALIWVTGLAALWMRGGMEGLGASFHAKLGFVVLLTLAHGFGRYTAGQIRRTGNMGLLPRLGTAGFAVWASAVAALALAIVTFSG